MKTIKLLFLALPMALFVQNTVAKGQTIGLYLTVNDYLNHKLSYSGNKIRINDFFETSNVTLTHEGKKQLLHKNEVFGYSKDDHDYRFFNNIGYRILENKGLFIYSRTKLIQQVKGPNPTERYYFSPGLSEPILPLTIANLQKVYAKYPKFIYAAEALFRRDDDLVALDGYTHKYKLTYLYEQNVN